MGGAQPRSNLNPQSDVLPNPIQSSHLRLAEDLRGTQYWQNPAITLKALPLPGEFQDSIYVYDWVVSRVNQDPRGTFTLTLADKKAL